MEISAMENSAEQIEYLYGIIHSYTVFFLIFDALFLVAVAFAMIKFLKSKKKIRLSGGYLRYTIMGQEEERARIARELHDTVAQDLRYCKSLSEQVAQDDIRQTLVSVLDKSISEVRSMSYNLAPPDVTRNDVAANIMNLCNTFTSFAKIEMLLTIPEGVNAKFLSQEENLNIYRIVQESLNNIAKHAQASEVTVLVRNEIGSEEKGLYIFITDDGIGFDTTKNYTSGTSHFGLVGMRERAQLIGVKLTISSAPGEGAQISLFKSEPAQKVDFMQKIAAEMKKSQKSPFF